MGLLKADEAKQAGVLHFSLRDIEAEAQLRLDRAAEQVEAILADAKKRVEQAEADARSEGFAAGHAEGLAQGYNEGRQQAMANSAVELSDLFTSLAGGLVEMNSARHRFESDALHETVDLAIAIATRVTKRQAKIDPQVMIENLRAALSLTIATGSADARSARVNSRPCFTSMPCTEK